MPSKLDPALHTDKKPPWIKVRLPTNPVFWSTKSMVSDLKLHTVCEEAQCPNRWECWSQGTATFMIAGDRCTRACGFCAVKTAKPFALEADEPARVATATKRMGLNHVVITAVARDDLADGGAQHFAETIEAVRAENPKITIEILVPDFNGKDAALQTVNLAGISTGNAAESDTLAITANSPEVGEARETLAVNYKGKEMAIAFNPKYMIDPLGSLTEDEVFFELIDELSPGVLKINAPFLYVVMPMRLS